ncbi:MAG: TIGR02266 family protein [Oligoflexales bacterium]
MASKSKNKKTTTKATASEKGGSKDNRASGTRIPIQLLVDYKSDGTYLFDFCKDLGEGGVFIETKNPKKQGSELELTFTIPDSKQTLSTKGKVIWVQDPIDGRQDLTPGMGIQFEAFDANDRKTLEDFVRRYSTHISKSAS